MKIALLLAIAVLSSSCLLDKKKNELLEKTVNDTLNNFHKAAAQANGKMYFSFFANDAVFLGTDAKERWTLEEFKEYAKPHFDKGKGWTYFPLKRFVNFNQTGNTAWFDEVLLNEKLGECRGSGVLVKIGGKWLVKQYNLTVPVPNELVLEMASLIRKMSKK